MSEPVTLAEAKGFLRVTHGAEDGLIATLVAAAVQRVQAETGLVLHAGSPAGLRLAVLQQAAEAFERREDGRPEGWTRPPRSLRL